ncbi:Aldehyde dehydrogenase OS=Streptomyces tendae OX=1932 GN=GUR47_01755 PE=4 SV=1 [Streptomyces tendae]
MTAGTRGAEPLTLKSGTSWADAWRRCRTVAPEAFRDDRVLNLWDAGWRADGRVLPATSPVDGTPITGPPRIDAAASTPYAPRSTSTGPGATSPCPSAPGRGHPRRPGQALGIGKRWRSTQADVDRAVDGVRWYVDGIEDMLDGRAPLDGPVSNIASWNYPMSVLVHALLVQALAGNAVIAKTPTDGGVACLTLACALAAREGLPVTLVSGSGGELSQALVRAPEIGCVSFVGGRDAGGAVTAVADLGKRHVLEQEGLNTWGIWNFTDWATLARVVPKLAQRQLFDAFLAAYLRPVRTLRVGHPLITAPDTPFRRWTSGR